MLVLPKDDLICELPKPQALAFTLELRSTLERLGKTNNISNRLRHNSNLKAFKTEIWIWDTGNPGF